MWAWLLAAAQAASPGAVSWIRDVQIGDPPARVDEVLRRSGATRVEALDFRQPGAFARGLLDAPGLLGQLHRAGVEPALFDGLPASGPRFVVAEGPEGRASYVFVQDRLWAMALALTAQAVAPREDPFRRDRLEPLLSTLDAVCGRLRATWRDEYGNPTAWAGQGCSGGTLAARYDPLDSDAAVQIVVFGP